MYQQRQSAFEADDLMNASMKKACVGVGAKKLTNLSVNVEKQRLNTKVVTHLEHYAAKLREHEGSFVMQQSQATKMLESPDADITRTAQNLLSEGLQMWRACKDHIDAMIAKMTTWQKEMYAADTVEQVQVVAVLIHNSSKTLNMEATKRFREFLVQLCKTQRESGANIARKSAGARLQKEKDERPKPPLWLILMADERDDVNIAQSIFETKAGVRASASGFASIIGFETVLSNGKVKSAIKANRNAIAKGVSSCKTPLVFSVQSWNRFRGILVSSMSADLFTQPSLPRVAWASRVVNLEVISTDNTNVEISWGAFGMMENRMVLHGDMTVHGFFDSHIPGDNFSDKRNYLIQTGPQELARLLALGGFRAQFINGISTNGDSILSMPTGFVFITACSECSYVRWSFSGDQGDALRAKVALQHIIDSFPEKKQTAGYVDYARFLGLRV